jgi:hypothetical protein
MIAGRGLGAVSAVEEESGSAALAVSSFERRKNARKRMRCERGDKTPERSDVRNR